MHRTSKDGLGRAYIAGFEHALAGGAELVIEMDADFSHDPKYLGALLAAAEDADLVLGSSYVAGGAVRQLGRDAQADQPRRQHVRARRARGAASGT